MEKYKLDDIFNCDEAAIFWKQLPTATLATRVDQAKGGKLAKDRITVLFCCSAAGEKLKPLVIGRSANPRAFKNKRAVVDVLVAYKFNQKAWMTTTIFKECLTALNDDMKRQKRQIALLLDNATCHPHLKLSNIKLTFLPPKTTCRLQPLDAGIIRLVKALFRKELVRYVVKCLKEMDGKATEICKKKVTVFEAIKWISSAWECVSNTTAAKCFAKYSVNFFFD